VSDFPHPPPGGGSQMGGGEGAKREPHALLETSEVKKKGKKSQVNPAGVKGMSGAVWGGGKGEEKRGMGATGIATGTRKRGGKNHL